MVCSTIAKQLADSDDSTASNPTRATSRRTKFSNSEFGFYSLGAGTGVECSLTYLRVAACNVIPDAVAQRGSAQELIRVSFALEKGPSADVARFTVKTPYGDYPGFTARDSLSGGTAIADRIVTADPEAQGRLYSLGSSVGCEVSYVHFIDGTSWSAPTPSP